MSDLDRQIEQLRRCEIIKEFEVKALCSKAREILVEESNVQRVDSPVTVSTILILRNTFLSHHLNPFISGLWRYSRSILRLERVIQSRWRCSRHKLLVYGRFRRSRFLFSRNIPSFVSIKGKKVSSS